MKVREVAALVDDIRRHANDDERAHVCEDDMRLRVLKAIADGSAEDPVEMARLAASTDEFDFCRWYA